nr:hypothetical protein CFP56_39987 [Quercus suber]
MKDCIEVKKSGDQSEMKERQYGAWLRGEAGDKVMEKNCPKEGPKGKSGNLRSTIPTHKDADKKKTPNKTDEVVVECLGLKSGHWKRMAREIRPKDVNEQQSPSEVKPFIKSKRYTWCNSRLGEQRTLIRLDRGVANKAWKSMFPKASVHHLAMSASDHCIIVLYLKRKIPTRPAKRRFMFEAMWTRDERCKQIIENAWDPFRDDTNFRIHERLKSCQDHLQSWNREVFGNVNKTLRMKQQRLQELEALNML